MTNDKDIIAAIRKDPEQGFRLLLRQYREPLYWHIRRLVVSHDDAEDATQEAFIRMFRNFDQYGEGNSFKAWLYRIATNEALRLLGRRQGCETLPLDEVTEGLMETACDAYFSDGDALVARLQRAILHLPAKQQLAFNLRYYDELSYAEIAAVSGSSEASAKTNYHLAKEKIIQYMNSNE